MKINGTARASFFISFTYHPMGNQKKIQIRIKAMALLGETVYKNPEKEEHSW